MSWTRRKFLEVGGVLTGAVLTIPPVLVEAKEKPQVVPQAPDAHYHGQDAVTAASDVLHRQLGARAAEFELRSISATAEGHEVFELKASNGKVTISGSSGVAICRGAYTYLRESCHVMIAWSGSHLELPSHWPDASHRRVECPYRFVQYFNPCTYGYTMPFWNWARWEKELDWMALHGINLPLALEGQEIIWNRVWKSYGIPKEEIEQFSVGAPYQPWHWMGNIDRFAGPLADSFIEKKRVLQQKILNRMRDLGMKPVVPGFSGFVPQGFLRVQSDARFFTLLWQEKNRGLPRSTRTFILHPGDETYYKELGRRFIQAYKEEYGEVSYYLADAFNELKPPVTPDHRQEELRSFGRTIYQGILAGDPNGTWIMQGWLFVHDPDFWGDAEIESFLKDVPNDRIIVMDYGNDLVPVANDTHAANRWKAHHAFFGKQWMNGMIHTFGGNNTVRGNLKLIASQPASVLKDPGKGNLVAWGMCPEGIESNEVAFELLTDVGWQLEAIDLEQWIPAYCRARYGAYPKEMKEAWSLLLESAYSAGSWRSKHAWQREPVMQPTPLAVDTSSKFHDAVHRFLACAPELQNNLLYRNDLIELVSQAAGGQVDACLKLATEAISAGKMDMAKSYGEKANAWLLEIDGLMNVRADRRLETWVNSARNYGLTDAESAALDENGRQLITVWGWPELSDYASRVWSGLIRDYYAPRWKIWIDAAVSREEVSIELWEQTWLARPYMPTTPISVSDPITYAKTLLARTENV